MDNNTPPNPQAEPAAVIPAEPAAAPAAEAAEDKTVAIVAYLTLIGFIIAVILFSNKKTSIGAYHLRQSLGLVLAWVVLVVISLIPFLGWVVGPLGMIFLFVLWLFGLISAINGQKKPVPVLGPLFEQWFGATFD